MVLVFLSNPAWGADFAATGPAPAVARQGERALADMEAAIRAAIANPTRIRGELCATLQQPENAPPTPMQVAGCPAGTAHRVQR